MAERKRILLVEDNLEALSGLFTLLSDAGYSVFPAENGAEAVDLLSRSIHPELIVLDLVLPKVSGWEVLKYLREDLELRNIPVIVMTGVAASDARIHGADVVLQKPLQPWQLVDEVARLIDGPAA